MANGARHRRKSAPSRRVVARIETIAAGGDGVTIIDGAKVFIPFAAPGDLAAIDVKGERGELVELVEPSTDRADPPCRHFGRCGGCALQHVSRDYYRRWKRERITDALSKAGLGEIVLNETIETPAASRRRATFAVRKLRGDILLGFNARRSSEIVVLEDCRVLHPELLSRLPALRELARTIDAPAFDLAATLCDNGLDLIIAGAATPRSAHAGALIEVARRAGAVRLSFADETVVQFAAPLVSFDGVPVSPPPGAFLQASREGEAALIALVKTATAGARRIADLFSGSGTFALPVARSASVLAVDADAASIAALARAAGEAQRTGLVHPLKAEARDLFERPFAAKELKGFDAVVFDPPRAGAAAQAAEIARSGVPTVIGVSCNPSTFARDAALLATGGYRLREVTPVDQFVYSPHVELVGVFRKN